MSVHFFLKTGFYKCEISGVSILVPLMFLTLFMTCVPLFIILSGFLLNYRKINLRHFLSLRKILLQYFICTMFLFAFDAIVGWRIISLKSFIENVLTFGQYSWYVKKYVLLFLMMPFINAFFRENESNKIRMTFLAALMVVVLVPSTLELLGGTGLSDVLLKVSDKLYPTLYYSVGVYYFYNKGNLSKNCNSKFLLGILMGTLFLSKNGCRIGGAQSGHIIFSENNTDRHVTVL